MSHKKVLVVGLGRFGSALAEELWNTTCELLVVDKDPEAVDAHKSRASAAFVADASEPGVLENIGARVSKTYRLYDRPIVPVAPAT